MVDENPESTEDLAPRQRITKAAGSNPISSGWSVDRRPPAMTGDRPDKFVVKDVGEEVLIAFLEAGPFASFYQHWVPMGGKARQPRVCLGEDCPLCAVGDRPKSADHFNVILMGEEPKLQVWYATADPAAAIKQRADNKRTSPINKEGLYWAVSKADPKKNGIYEYSVDPVREDELDADWGVAPLTEEQIAAFQGKAYTSDIVKVHTKSELREIADKLEE